MAAHITVSVHNLLPETTAEDIEVHFTKYSKDCNPLVGPIVQYLQQREEIAEGGDTGNIEDAQKRKRYQARLRLAATVSFEGPDVEACEELRELLHGSELYPRRAGFESSQIAVQREFLGFTPINEHKDPQFDFFFVHGLGGHAFTSWTEPVNAARDLKMWPRDLLPGFLLDNGYNGRYATIGYKANPRLVKGYVNLPFLRGNSQQQEGTTITTAAENLLSILREAMTHHNRRPIYFVCHSLGGLVVCQALILALWKGRDARIKTEHNRLFMRNGKCIVKGIVFFGTPFQGSLLADYTTYAGRLVELLGADKTLLQSLKMNNKELAQITGKFSQVRETHDIKLVIYYESKPTTIKKIISVKVTSAGSAKGSFGREFPPRALDADHRTMIKYAGEMDLNYGQVREDILNLVKGTLPKFSEEMMTAENPPSPISLTSPAEMRSFASSSSSGSEPGQDAVPYDRDATMAAYNLLERCRHFLRRALLRRKVPARSAKRDTGSAKRVNPRPLVTYNPANSSILRTDFQGSTDSQPKSATSEKVDGSLLPLRHFDTVFIFDDSESMQRQVHEVAETGERMTRWESLIRSVQVFGDIAAKNDDDGVDVHFLNNRDKDRENVRSGQAVLDILAKIDRFPKEKFMDDVLRFILDAHLRKYHFYINLPMRATGTQIRSLKPLNVIVISDGVSKDHEKVEATLVRTARELRRLNAPATQIGVQFVQIGNDETAAAWLKTLDDKLRDMYGVRDIVDTRPFNNGDRYQESLQTKLRQILLGAVSRAVDEEEDIEEQTGRVAKAEG